jgi:hypothetical protein
MTYNLIEQAHQTVERLKSLTIAFNDGVLRGTERCAQLTAVLSVPTTALIAYSEFVNPSLRGTPAVVLPFIATIFSLGATAGAGLLSAASSTLTGFVAGKDAKFGETQTEETHAYATTPTSYKWGKTVAFATALASGVAFSDHVLLDNNKTPQSISLAPAPAPSR